MKNSNCEWTGKKVKLESVCVSRIQYPDCDTAVITYLKEEN